MLKSTWYDIAITCEQRSIKVHMGFHTPANAPTPDEYGPQDN